MHKYWSRKPFNVVAEYIRTYTDEGDIVLDPFCGSGITAIEAIRLRRKVVAADLNPMAAFITRMTLEPVDLLKFKWAFQDVKNNVYKQINGLYETICSKCGRLGVIHHTEWNCEDPFIQIPIRIIYSCSCSDKLLIKDVGKGDLKNIEEIRRREIPFWYPKNIKLPAFRREKRKYFHQLFTHRNLIALSILNNALDELENPKIRDMTKFVFTSSLAQASMMKMITKDRPTATSKGWIAPRYYVPPRNQELNVWINFETRFNRIFQGKKGSNRELQWYRQAKDFSDLAQGKGTALLLQTCAFDLSEIPEKSIDYIFTDPPYGGNIPYLGLSAFWGSWMKYSFDWEKEITLNPDLGKNFDLYRQMLSCSFKKMHELLKPKKYLTVSFHSTRRTPWDFILRTAVKEKFDLEKIVYQPLSKSFSQSVRGRGDTTVGDYYIRFLKPKTLPRRPVDKVDEDRYEKKVVAKAMQIIRLRGEPTRLIYILTNVYEFLNRSEILLPQKRSIEHILRHHIGKEFVLQDTKDKREKRWWLVNANRTGIVPLSKKVKKCLIDILSYEKDMSRFDMLQGVLKKLPGPLTPDLEYVNCLLQEYIQIEEDRPQWKELIARFKKKLPLDLKQHNELIYFLAMYGKQQGFDVWVGKRKNEEVYVNKKLKDLDVVSDLKLPPDYQDKEDILDNLDVLWLKKGDIVCEFEIENNNNISESMLKSSDFLRKISNFERIFVVPRKLQQAFRSKSFREKWAHWGLIFFDELIDYLEAHSQIDKEILAIAKHKYGQFPLEEREKKIVHTNAKIVSHEKVKGDHYRMVLRVPNIDEIEPGQFLHILCDSNPRRNMWFTSEKIVGPGQLPKITGIESTNRRPLLRRPISVHRIYYEGFDHKELAKKNPLPKRFRKLIHRPHLLIDILYKKVGVGTEFLSKFKKGEHLDILGPIGKGYFKISEERDTAILVAGGIGVAPLMALADRLRYEDKRVYALIGAMGKEAIPLETVIDSTVAYSFADMQVDYLLKEFREIGVETLVATKDGSLGEKGLVTDLFRRILQRKSIDFRDSVVYSCGPKPMLKEVARIARSFNLPCQVLLEQRIGCGTGKCLSCVVKIKSKKKKNAEFKLVCTDGPVFDAEEVVMLQ